MFSLKDMFPSSHYYRWNRKGFFVCPFCLSLMTCVIRLQHVSNVIFVSCKAARENWPRQHIFSFPFYSLTKYLSMITAQLNQFLFLVSDYLRSKKLLLERHIFKLLKYQLCWNGCYFYYHTNKLKIRKISAQPIAFFVILV